MDNQLVLCKNCTRCFNSPRGLRSHMKMHKKKQPSGGGGSSVTSSSLSSNTQDEAGGVLTTKMIALSWLRPLALQMIDPSSTNYNEAEDPCLQGSQRKGGVASSSSSSSNPKDEAGILTKATTMEMMVHVDPQPLTLQKAVVPSSYSRHNEAGGRRRRRGQGSQQQRREYVCVDCDMSFNSHYALGGHRSSKHSRKRLQQQTLLLPPAAPNNNNQVGLLLRRSQRLRLFGVNLDVVPAASSL